MLKTERLILRKAKKSESGLLSALALRSKAHWGYSSEFLENAREDLQVTGLQIQEGHFFVCEYEGKTAGYFGFETIENPEMVALFVEPKYIGKGVGYFLWQQSISLAKDLGWTSFKIVADPFAAKEFYLKLGCKQIGEVESPVKKGRMLPVLFYSM